jgi:hypothetical protein
MRKSTSTLIFLLLCAALRVSAQSMAPNYYVVIGVFSKLDNAMRLTDKVNLAGFNAQYAINARQNWNYVYLLETTEKRKAVQKLSIKRPGFLQVNWGSHKAA